MIWKITLALITAMLMLAPLGYFYHVANAQSFSKKSSTNCEGNVCHTSIWINNNCQTSIYKPTELLNSMQQINSMLLIYVFVQSHQFLLLLQPPFKCVLHASLRRMFAGIVNIPILVVHSSNVWHYINSPYNTCLNRMNSKTTITCLGNCCYFLYSVLINYA